VELRPIGRVHSPFKRIEVVRRYCGSAVGEIEVFKECEMGLKDILMDFPSNNTVGVFATRYPNRPNPIGFTVVEFLERGKYAEG